MTLPVIQEIVYVKYNGKLFIVNSIYDFLIFPAATHRVSTIYLFICCICFTFSISVFLNTIPNYLFHILIYI